MKDRYPIKLNGFALIYTSDGNRHSESETFLPDEPIDIVVCPMTDRNTNIAITGCGPYDQQFEDGRIHCRFRMPENEVTVTVTVSGGMMNTGASPIFADLSGLMLNQTLSPKKGPTTRCPSCGAEVPDMNFCCECGHKLRG